MQMSNLMNGGGAGGPGAFPAPGVPGATATQGGGAPSPGAAPFFNPWVPTSSTSPGGTPAAGTGAAAGAAAGAPPNPFASMFDPAMMQQMKGGEGPIPTDVYILARVYDVDLDSKEAKAKNGKGKVACKTVFLVDPWEYYHADRLILKHQGHLVGSIS